MSRLFLFSALCALFYGGVYVSGCGEGTFIGCFVDAPIRLLDGFTTVNNALKVNDCVDLCRQKGFHYAGVEAGNECFCGQCLKKATPVGANQCNFPCSGDPTKLCGGGWRLAVYDTGVGEW